MSTDLDQLLLDTVPEPPPVDVDTLWQGGRRRRRLRWATAASSALAMVALAGVGIAALAGGPDLTGVEIEPIAPPTVEPETAEEPVEEPEVVEEPEPADEEPVEEEEAPDEVLEEEPVEEEPVDEPGTAPQQAPVEEAPPSPQPDPARVAEPCAPHQGREAEAFLDVVAPVVGQHVGGHVDLVGCSNVYEATVRYRFTTPAGDLLADGVTTATCGSGCVGEVRDRISVPSGSGEVVLTVFWEDVNDGSHRDAVAITVVRN